MQGFNPYQPPAHPDVPPPPTVLGEPGEPLIWDIETALSVGWDRVKHWWPVLILVPAMVGIVNAALSWGLQQLGIPALDLVVSLVVGSFLTVGMFRMFLSAMRTEEPQFEQILSGADRMWPMLGTQLLMILAIMLGTIAFVIPGFIIGFGLCLAPFICVDQKLGPIDSLKKSWAIMSGCKLSMLGFSLVGLVLVIVGVLALVVGVFVANAVLYAAFTWIYLRRRGEMVPDRLADRFAGGR